MHVFGTKMGLYGEMNGQCRLSGPGLRILDYHLGSQRMHIGIPGRGPGILLSGSAFQVEPHHEDLGQIDVHNIGVER